MSLEYGLGTMATTTLKFLEILSPNNNQMH